MVQYEKKGDGTVVVSLAPGQTGGSGFGSEGTYTSEQAARSSVESGTREGDISLPRAGGAPTPKSFTSSSGRSQEQTPAQQQNQAQQQLASSPTPIITGAMQRSRFDYTYGLENLPGIPKEEWLAKTREGKVVQVVDKPHVKGYQWVTPEDDFVARKQAAQTTKNIQVAAPVTAGLYEKSAALTSQIQTGFGDVIGYSPTAHPGIKVLFGAGSIVSGLPQFVGMGAVVAEFAARNPLKLPRAVVVGLPLMAAEMTKQVYASPYESAGMIAAMVAGPKAIKVISEKIPAVKARGIDIPKGQAGLADVKTPITQWKSPTTNPVWTPGKGWSDGGVPPGIPKPITQWKSPTTNPVWTPGKGWVATMPASGGAAGAASGLIYRGLSVEHGKKAQPIIGISDQPVTNIASLKIGGKTIVAGTPKFKPEAIPEIYKSQFMSETGYREFGSPTELRIAMSNIPQTYDLAIQDLLTGTITKRQMTYGVKSTHQLKDVPLEDVFARHELGLATQKNLRAYLQKQQDLIIWGSTANKAQVMGKGGSKYFREIHDIDLHVKNPAQTTKELLAVISKTEPPGKVSMKGGGLATKKGHLFDIKTIEGGLPEEIGLSLSQSPKTGNVFLFPEEATGRIGKFQVQSLSSQATAKLSSIAMREKTVSAAAHRTGKDAFDLAFINEPALTKDLARSWNPMKRIRAGKAEKLDTQIQKLTEAKIGKQPVGDLPGQITAQQKQLFFDNLRAMRAGQQVVAAPKSELLYASPARGQPKPSLPADMIRAGGLFPRTAQPQIQQERISFPERRARTYDQGSISRQVHQAISSQKIIISSTIPRRSGSGASGRGSVRMPGYPSTPKYPPGYPSTPKYPPGYPSTPRYPGYPSTPRYPGYPSTPRYPGYPSTPRYPGGYPPPFVPPKTPNIILPKPPSFDRMGGPRQVKGRMATAYTIQNPFSGLKDLVGAGGFPKTKKGKKNWWENL